MKTIKQNIIKYLLFILVLGLFTNGCFCPTSNYAGELKSILNPMTPTLVDFYIHNQRVPNTRERNKMLEDRGCLFGDRGDNYCKKFGVWFKVKEDISNYNYIIFLSESDIFCSIGIYINDVQINDANCGNYCTHFSM